MKKKAGQPPVNNIKTSNFLPSVFQTPLNKNWLDSTMDQMVSKGPLENINGYIGNRGGRDATSTDDYIDPKFHKALRKKNQLQPGAISYDNSGNLTNAITFDDVAHSINENFATYNYNAAYGAGLLSYTPPINIDKLVNYQNYRWVEELPIYESIWTGAVQNSVTIAENTSVITDDNNTINIEEGMLIKFTGSGQHADILNDTYIVVGKPGKYNLHLYFRVDGATVTRVYNNITKHTQTTDGVYTNSKLLNVFPNTASSYWVAGKTPEDLVAAYNADATRLPIFDGFKFEGVNSNPEQLMKDVFVKFKDDGATTWTHATTNASDIYSITIDATTGNLTITPATAAEKNTLKLVSPGPTVSGTGANSEDTVMYHLGLPVVPLKDYIVISKDDPAQTAWSRANHWVNISTINKLKTLLPTYDFTEVSNVSRHATRPIIEYNSEINLWNSPEYSTYTAISKSLNIGTVDWGVASEAEANSIAVVGDTYVYINNLTGKAGKRFTVTLGTPTEITLGNNTTFTIADVKSSYWNDWKNADAFVESGLIKLAQQKTKINQYPLYRFYNCNAVPLENIDGVSFKGEKIFGYKQGTGIVDTELGIALSFKDTPKGAEFEFENFITTKKYYNTYKHVKNDNLSHTKSQLGYSLFKHRDVLKTTYIPTSVAAGATDHVQYEVTAADTPFVIPKGRNNWRPTQTYYIHSDRVRYVSGGGQYAITTAHHDGVSHATRVGTTDFIEVGIDQIVYFYNLTGGVITHTAAGEVTITVDPSDATKFKVELSALSNGTMFDIMIGGHLLQSFIATEKWDHLYHQVTVNGKSEEAAETVNNDSISIDESVLAVGDIIDLRWNNNDLTNKTTNTSMPDIHEHNVHNKMIETFTLSETMDHWSDKLNTMHGFDGNTFDENNYASIPTCVHGGTIFMYEDGSIMNDINYSNNKLSITGSLSEQANEFVAFRNRVAAQARRVYGGDGATSIQELTNKVIDNVTRNRFDTGMYKESNMLYTQTDNTQSWDVTDLTTTSFRTGYTFNGDVNIRDHGYLYLTEWNGSYQCKKLLLKDKDYDIIGNFIIIKKPFAALDPTLLTAPKLELVFTQMDSGSYVPPSMVKLGLAYGTEPQILSNTLYTHDGMQIDITGKNIENIQAGAAFDPVNAVIFEMEKRIYAGLVKEDSMYIDLYGLSGLERYNSTVDFIPTPQNNTWFTLNDLDNYLEKHYYQWANLNKITSLNTLGYYDAADPFTWNYSTLSLLGTDKLPGHYKGAYTHIFGTTTPHITPWHMLGHGFKPSWWDDHYSWKDTANGGDDAKRAALIDALKKGIVSKPTAGNTVQVVANARNTWDWATKCPVTTTGALEDLSTVLGTPANVDKAADFVFGDWGPVEQKWRTTAIGQAMTVDAIIKLVPGKAWTNFFQPGFISQFGNIVKNTTRYSGRLASSNQYKMPGEIYGNSVTSIDVINTKDDRPGTLEATGSLKIMDDYESTIATATYRLNEYPAATGSIRSISVTDRGLDFTGTPVVAYVGTTGAATGLSIDVTLAEVPFVANGIAQAQYNYIKRNQHNVSQTELYKNLTTKLQQKLCGFTSKHLLDLSAESSLTGDFELGEGDFNIAMYRGAVTDSLTASAVFVKKTLTGYSVTGVSNNNREFKFLEPNLVNAVDYNTVTISDQQIRRYNKFVTTASIAEYDTVFQKVQDTYNFLRGYWEWMRVSGYTTQYDGDSIASAFVTWTLAAEVGNVYILQIGREVKFKPTHGHVYEYNQLSYNGNGVLSTDSGTIQNKDLSISRADGTVSLQTKNAEFFGSITSAILDYEHVIIFENKTTQGIHLFDDVKNRRQTRLLLRGQRTQNWTGEKKAPGYLVSDNTIIQNFDSAVQSIDDMYRTDVNEFNASFSKAKDLTIGNIDGTMLDGLGLDKNVLTNFYQGMIKDKGTKNAIEHIGKSRLLDGDATTVSVYEQYMFRQSELGNNDMEDPLEIEIVSKDINSSPQTVSLEATGTNANTIYTTSKKIINDKAITFETKSYDDSDSDILTGGEPLENETRYHIADVFQLSTVFDSTADYAIIPTWNSYTSYKKGDQVRHEGKLLECTVDYTGLTEKSSTIILDGTNTFPSFVYGTVANIAGTTVTLQKTQPEYSNIVATGTVSNPTLMPGAVLTIDGVSIPFNKSTDVPTVSQMPYLQGTLGPVAFSNVTGKTISITIDPDGTGTSPVTTAIDFDTTPPDVVENFTGVLSQTDFTIAQALTGSTYSVGSITIDGANETGYTVSGQDITFTSAPLAGTAIVVTLVHLPHQKTDIEIRDKINAAGIASFAAAIIDVSGVNVLKLTYTTSHIDAILRIEPGATNADLGFDIAGQEDTPTSVLIATPQALTLTEIRDAINNVISPALTKITASAPGQYLILTSTNRTAANLIVTGAGATTVGLTGASGSPAGNYPYVETIVNVAADMGYAVARIQEELVAQSLDSIVSATVVQNRIRITSTATTLTMGATTFNALAGLETGTVTSAESTIVNVFDTANWTGVAVDPALYNILVTDDSNFEVETSGTIVTKFWGWNVLQVQNNPTPLYTKSTPNITETFVGDATETVFTTVSDVSATTYSIQAVVVDSVPQVVTTDFTVSGQVITFTTAPTTAAVIQVTMKHATTIGCGICAGTSSRDGNDAEITTNVAHGLQVGDYVQLLNTTTTPKIDGIHKVTKISANTSIFYIDEYIESCGNAVSVLPLVTTRFADTAAMNAIYSNARWNLEVDKLVWASKTILTLGAEATRGTYVRKTKIASGSVPNAFIFVRDTIARPTNKDIDSIVIYNHADNRAKAQLEVWDPMRKIIPGIASQNLDYSNGADNAIYTHSTDITHLVDEDTSWGEDQIGTRWWDLSTVRYYDYDQGSSSYKASTWGKVYPGSSVDVYEWIKSTVAPDDYAAAVEKNTEMFGTVATGTAFSVYNNITEENLYYYTSVEEWNPRTSSYIDVYYYWVKNKTTTTDTRTLSAADVANIIKDPTANGVSWFAVISSNEFIIDNISYYIEDKNTVLQINKKGDKYKSHNEWTLIAESNDIIPEYYINGMKRNLAGRTDTKFRIPFSSLHRFNKYGDDLDIGQAWFNDLSDARRNAVITINSLLQYVNLDQAYKNTWDRTLVANNFPTVLWNWHDYKLESYTGTINHTLQVDAYSALANVDRNRHLVVKIPVFDRDVQLDRSEIYAYNTVTKLWDLVHKRNVTVQFNVSLLSLEGGWDQGAWDTAGWDQADLSEYWETLITALHKDIFVQYNISEMNTFFFSIVKYVLASFAQTNWIRKTAYVQLEFNNTIDTKTRKYKKDKTNNAIGYIQEVKPFHTKISTTTNKYSHKDTVGLTLTETPQTVISVKHFDIDAAFGGTTYTAEAFGTDTATTTLTGGDFTTNHTNTDIVSGVGYNSPEYFNYTTSGANRNSLVEIKPLELLRINVQTNTAGSTHTAASRTFAHIQDASGYVRTYALLESKEAVLAADLTIVATSISVASTSNFDDTGIAYVGGELIEYIKENSTTLNVLKRGVAGTFATAASTGTSITQVNTAELTFANEIPSAPQYNALSDTILNSPGSTIAQELLNLGKGIEL